MDGWVSAPPGAEHRVWPRLKWREYVPPGKALYVGCSTALALKQKTWVSPKPITKQYNTDVPIVVHVDQIVLHM